MLGAIYGDIVGSVYEHHNIKTKDFVIPHPFSRFTDDTVMSVAVADALLQYESINDIETFRQTLTASMRRIGQKYPYAGYGGKFAKWLAGGIKEPYNSFGNGSAMRVSPVAWYAKTPQEVILLAKATADVTHNHPEGIKGAVAVAMAVYLAKNGAYKEDIKGYIQKYYYPLDFTLDEIRPTYRFDVTCQGSVPQALEAFFESENFEDAVRNAISIGGDSDTIAAITGSIAEAYYGMNQQETELALSPLTKDLYDIVTKFRAKYQVPTV